MSSSSSSSAPRTTTIITNALDTLTSIIKPAPNTTIVYLAPDRSDHAQAQHTVFDVESMKPDKGRDKLPADAFAHPGDAELWDSLKSVEKDWRSVREDDYTHLLDVRDWDDKRGVPVFVTDEQYTKAMAEVGRAEYEVSVLAHSKSLCAIHWLAEMLARMHITEYLGYHTMKQVTPAVVRHAKDPKMAWAIAAKYHNGNVKTLWELFKYLDEKTEKRWRAKRAFADDRGTFDDAEEEEEEKPKTRKSKRAKRAAK